MPVAEGGIAYEVTGDGPPLVLLNGVMMTMQSWVFQRRALAGRFRCVLHDFRGQLLSPGLVSSMTEHVDDLAALLDHLAIGSAHIMGTSYGGEVGMMFASRFPERVRDLRRERCTQTGSLQPDPRRADSGRGAGHHPRRPARRGD